MTGQIAGLAGAYGNVGAVVYLVVYSLVEPRTFFLVLAAGAAISLLYCLVFLEEPEGSFAEEVLASVDHERDIPVRILHPAVASVDREL